MKEDRFCEIARNVFRAGNIQVLSNQEYKEFIRKCRIFKKMPMLEIISFPDNNSVAFREYK